MKLTKLHLTLALAASMFAISAIAGSAPKNWPPGFPTRIKTQAAVMKCCLPREKIALACKGCKTIREKSGEDKKDILAWFKADSTHGCSGCGGTITVHQIAGGKAPTTAHYTHTCSKCSADSAFTCATHKG